MRLPSALSLCRLRLPLLVCLAGFAIFSLPAQESAARSCPKTIDRTYYSDASHTVVVGSCTTACNRVTNCSGVQTAFSTVETEPCPCFVG